ncbi:MAG: peptidoglycan DD-metalloendopeptidase family protein [Cyanobacteriota bacterium]|nr:peptidoglycan DD-metalloendopeptidase family protein [Cyanobacteriota bacterium]
MKGTVPHSDQSATGVSNSEAQVELAQQVVFSGSSKAYTSAAFLGLALASGILCPEGSQASTIPSIPTRTPEVHPTSDSLSDTQAEENQASTPGENAEWQPSLLRNLSRVNARTNQVLFPETELQSEKLPKSGLGELSAPAVVGSPSSPTGSMSASEVEANSPTANGSENASRSLTPSRSAQLNSTFPQTAGTSQPSTTSEMAGAVVIESELTENAVSVLYRVNSGETLAQIAHHHNVSVDDIIEANNLADPNFIQTDQHLRIPQRPSHRSFFQNPSSNQPNRFGSSEPLTTVSPDGVQSPSTLKAQSLETDKFGESAQTSQFSSKLKSRASKSINSRLSRVQPYTLAPNAGDERQLSLRELATIKAPGSVERPTAILSQSLPARAGYQTQLVSANVELSKSSVEKDISSSQVHTSRLRADVDRLRQEYQMQQAQQLADTSQQTSEEPLSPEDVTPTTTPQPLLLRRINPEFNPDAYQRQKETAGGNTQPPEQSAQSLESVSPDRTANLSPQEQLEAESSDEQSVVATAPLNSSADDLLKNPALGRIVSPDLPPLAGPDTYLPGGSMRFNGYIWPSRGILTSGYGWRWGRMHRGIDIAAPIGTPIFAAAPGVVTYAGWNSGGYGNLVEIEHPDGSLTVYAHNSRILVNKGQKVAQGQQVSEMGSTGRSTGPHLHFEIHPSGQGAVNPMALLPRERNNVSQR